MYYTQYLAIDYGTTHIKGILYRQFLGSVTILRHETLQIVSLPEKESDEYEYNIVRFIQSFFPEETSFLINIAMDNLFIRDLVLPSSSEKAIKEILPFEVENVVPFPIENMVVQGCIWWIGNEVSNVVAFSVHHDEVEKTFKPFMKNDIQLSCISTDSYSLSANVNYHQTKSIAEKVVGQLDIGGKLSIFNVNSNGLLSHSRFFSGGGFLITEKIAQLLKIEFNKAEQLKLHFNFSFDFIDEEFKTEFLKLHHITAEQFDKIINIIYESMDGIAEEIIKSIYALAPINRPSIIYLSGGGSSFKDTEKYLTNKIGTTVTHYTFLELEDPSFTTALGIGYHSRMKKTHRVDFLTPEFSKLMRNTIRLDAFKPHLILAGISLFILLTVFIVQMVIDNRKLKAYDTELREKFKQGFGFEVPEDDDVMSVALNKVKEENKKSEIVRLFLNKENILELILDLNQNFPSKDFDFILDQFTLDGNLVSIYGRVNEFQDIGAVQSALEKSQKFKNLKVVNKNLISGVTKLKVRFKIELEILNNSEKNNRKEEDNAQ
ncbi:MAG: pilus assembly protein PilM [Leptospiraceae bacterium]|nr:pilus assembly protein PilM [Leptospiraceae bacterium]